MTPFEIKLLLDIHCYACDGEHCGIPLARQTIGRFLSNGLIESTTSGDHSYQTTDRGKAMVKFLEETPLPLCAWVRPGSFK